MPPDDELDLRKYLHLIKEHVFWWITAFLLAGIAAFLISAYALPPVYEATTSLLIDEAPTGGDSEYSDLMISERQARTYAELITTQPIFEAVAARIGSTADALANAVTATWISNTQLIEINVKDADPVRAAVIANAVAEEFSANVSALQAERFLQSKESLASQLTTLEAQIEDAEAALAALGETEANQAERARRGSELNGLRNSYTNVLKSYEEVRLAESRAISNVIQIEVALPPDSPASPNIPRNTILGALLGLLLAFGVVLLRDTLSATLQSAEDLTAHFSLPVLGRIPHISSDKPALITANQPYLPVTEAFRTLRTNIRYSKPDSPPKRILITSPLPEDGKTTTAINLALTFIQSGKRVILIDADMRRPDIHKLLSLANDRGLSELLENPKASVGRMIQSTSHEGFYVITSGGQPANPSELLDSRRMLEVLDFLGGYFDVVLIDAPPLLVVTDAVTLALQADGVILVVRANQTRFSSIQQSLAQLEQVNALVLGGVVTNLGERGNGYYYQNYGYYGYGPAGEKHTPDSIPADGKTAPREPEMASREKLPLAEASPIIDLPEGRSPAANRVPMNQRLKRKKQPGSHRVGRAILIGIASLFLTFMLGLAGLTITYGATDLIFPGVTFNAVPIGGQTYAEAQFAIVEAWDDSQIVEVVRDGTAYEVPLAQFPVTFDPLGTAQSAYNYGRDGGFFGNVVAMLTASLQGFEIPPALIVDTAGLQTTLADWAETQGIPPEDLVIELDGRKIYP